MKPFSFFVVFLFIFLFVPQFVFAEDVRGTTATDSPTTTTGATITTRPDTTAPVTTRPDTTPSTTAAEPAPNEDGTSAPPPPRERTLPMERAGVTARPAPTEVKAPAKKVETNAQAGFNKDVQNQVGSIVKGISNAFHAIGNVLNSIKSFFLSVNAYLSK